MAIELITGKAGAPHIDSADIGAFNAYTIGAGVYCLHGLEATLPTANSITIAAGDGMGQGRHFRIIGAGETATIDNGQSGYKRNDIVAIKYTKDGSGIETPTLEVFKGTPTTGTPTDPQVPAGNVLDNASTAYWPLYRVPINGLTPGTPVALYEQLPLVASSNGEDTANNNCRWWKFSNGLAVVMYDTYASMNYQAFGNQYRTSAAKAFTFPFEMERYQLAGGLSGGEVWFAANWRSRTAADVLAYSAGSGTKNTAFNIVFVGKWA